MRSTITIFLVVLSVTSLKAQNKTIDSLRMLLQHEKTDTAKIRKLIEIGNAYSRRKVDSAVVYFQNALLWSEKIEFKNGEFQARSRLAGFLEEVKTDYGTALELYLKNIKTEEQTGDTSMIFRDLEAVALMYNRLEDFETALEYVQKFRNLANSGIIKDSARLKILRITADNRIGVTYDNLNRLDSAKYYKYKVYNYGIVNNDSGRIELGSLGLANIYRKVKVFDSAFYYFRIGMPISLKRGNSGPLRFYLNRLGMLHLQTKNSDSATYYAREALRLSQQEKDYPQMIGAAELLSEIYYTKKQPDSAYTYLHQSMLWKDSVFSAANIARIKNLDFQQSLQKMQEEQTRKEAVQEYKSRIKVYSLAAGLAGLLILILILYRNNRQRQAANKKIEKAYTDLKSTQAQLIQSEKMASLGELTAGIAHEIQNPLNFVNNFSDVNKELLTELNEEIEKGNYADVKAIAKDVIDNEEKINHHGKHADAIVKGMLQHSRASSGKKEPTDINALADEYLRLSYHGLRAKDKSFNADFKTDLDETIGKIEVMPQDIGRVLLNLYTNAFYAVTEKKKLHPEGYEPTVSVTTKKENNKLVIKVKDNGMGIPQKALDKIFQPFFTTKPTGQGTGLGLSLSYDIIKAHGGEMKVKSKDGEGAEFIIEVPIPQQ